MKNHANPASHETRRCTLDCNGGSKGGGAPSRPILYQSHAVFLENLVKSYVGPLPQGSAPSSTRNPGSEPGLNRITSGSSRVPTIQAVSTPVRSTLFLWVKLLNSHRSLHKYVGKGHCCHANYQEFRSRRAIVTRSPKEGYQFYTKKTSFCQNV